MVGNTRATHKTIITLDIFDFLLIKTNKIKTTSNEYPVVDNVVNSDRNKIIKDLFFILNLFLTNLKSASNLNGNLNCSKELEHYSS